MDENSIKLYSVILDFVAKALWPLLAIFIILKFRNPIEKLLHRLGSLKVAGSEWVFQLPAADPPEPKKQIQKMKLDAGADGFLTPQGVRDAVLQSGLLEDGDGIEEELLVFDTPNQRTWIIATKHSLMILLDDPETRRASRLIQTSFDKYKALPITTNARPTVASFRFNVGGTWWFYSLGLFPAPKDLQASVARLVAGRSPAWDFRSRSGVAHGDRVE